jgi:hypothetical protein
MLHATSAEQSELCVLSANSNGGAGVSLLSGLPFFTKYLTSKSCNCMVTHYASPSGYIFTGSSL